MGSVQPSLARVILFGKRKGFTQINMRIRISVLAVLALVSLASEYSSAQQAAQEERVSCGAQACPYLNPALAPEERAKDLVGRMTLEEKVSQMLDVAPAIPRLGVPAYNWWNEALHGVARNGFATSFPQSIGLAATWDTGLMHRIAATIAVEGRAKYNEAIREGDRSRFAGLTFWSPNVNIDRDPRWGRGMETYGEDPFLTASLGVEFVKGLQGDDARYLELVATPKHYAVHSGPEPLRHGFNVDVTDHDLEDTYLPAFRATIVDGHADSIMCAYNAIDGAPACASEMLLQQHLRQDWGFAGYVVSDCDAIADIVRGHHSADSLAKGDALAVKAGTDLDCGGAYKDLTKAAADRLLSEAEIDRAVVRLFTARMRLGMFDPSEMVPLNKIPSSEVNSEAHRELALEAARESIVLLKNGNGILPLKPAIRKIAVVGPTADLLEAVEGNYNGTAPDPVSPLRGLKKQFGAGNVIYAPGAVLAEGLAGSDPFAVSADGCIAEDRGSEGRVLRQSAVRRNAEDDARGREDQLQLEPRDARAGLSGQDICRSMERRIAAARGGRLRAGPARTAADDAGGRERHSGRRATAGRGDRGSRPALCRRQIGIGRPE